MLCVWICFMSIYYFEFCIFNNVEENYFCKDVCWEMLLNILRRIIVSKNKWFYLLKDMGYFYVCLCSVIIDSWC